MEYGMAITVMGTIMRREKVKSKGEGIIDFMGTHYSLLVRVRQ
jgi:hypothetical protein